MTRVRIFDLHTLETAVMGPLACVVGAGVAAATGGPGTDFLGGLVSGFVTVLVLSCLWGAAKSWWTITVADGTLTASRLGRTTENVPIRAGSHLLKGSDPADNDRHVIGIRLVGPGEDIAWICPARADGYLLRHGQQSERKFVALAEAVRSTSEA